jgi:HlyD family secretion protein
VKKALVTLVVLAAVGGTVFAYYNYHKGSAAPTVNTAAVVRGDVVDTVGATGTLQAVTTVQVGAQVSGIIQDLYADFNSLVKKGQVLARLDPSTIQTQIDQSRANLARSQADLQRLKVALDDANQKLKRAQELAARSLIPETDLETAQVNVRSADAQVKSQDAAIVQAEASLKQNQVSLDHTVIAAPIDGLVISRNVDRGQTVAASLQAPTLFVLAADLTKMQVIANLDESDVGRIRPGQRVNFRVDAYAADEFSGTVQQVRLQPITQQNVVTYATVIDVPNTDLRLKPGMTANVNIEIARRSDVLRVPNAALRFRPTNDIYAALGQKPPDPAQLRANFAPEGGGRPSTADSGRADAAGGRGDGRSRGNGQPPSDLSASSDNTARRGSGRGGRGGSGATSDQSQPAAESGRGRGSVGGRFQDLSPEERQQRLARFGRGRGSSGDQAGARSNRAAPEQQSASLTPKAAPATTIDALFGPLPAVESTGRVWLYVDKQLKPVRVRIGISDGQASELIDGDLNEGTEVVTNVITETQATRPAAGAGNPLFGQPQRGGFPGGGFPGGGGNRGGAAGGGGRGR